jgi:hypothetical protein
VVLGAVDVDIVVATCAEVVSLVSGADVFVAEDENVVSAVTGSSVDSSLGLPEQWASKLSRGKTCSI